MSGISCRRGALKIPAKIRAVSDVGDLVECWSRFKMLVTDNAVDDAAVIEAVTATIC